MKLYENELTLCFQTTLYAGGLAWTRAEEREKKTMKNSLNILHGNE